jgi:hypothetical protein
MVFRQGAEYAGLDMQLVGKSVTHMLVLLSRELTGGLIAVPCSRPLALAVS